jgi:hypothetical protein
MNYKELEQEVKRLEEQIKDLKIKLAEKSEKKPYEVKVPEDIDNYYYVDELGEVHSIGEKINYYDFEKVYQRGLAFKSKEEAEQFDKERILINRTKDWAKKYNGGWKPNWEESRDKFYIDYHYGSRCFQVKDAWHANAFHKLPYFKSEEIALQFIKEFVKEINEVLL